MIVLRLRQGGSLNSWKNTLMHTAALGVGSRLGSCDEWAPLSHNHLWMSWQNCLRTDILSRMFILSNAPLRTDAKCPLLGYSEIQLSIATSCPLLSRGLSLLDSSKCHFTHVWQFYVYIHFFLLFWRSLFKCCGKDKPRGIGGRGHLRDELLCGHWQPRWGGLLSAHPITGDPAEQCEDHHDTEPRQRPAAWRRHRPQQEVLHREN